VYRAFDCTGTAGSDTIVAAMSKAQEDGVNLVSMSLGIGAEAFDGSYFFRVFRLFDPY
jgi:hypothetical protein